MEKDEDKHSIDEHLGKEHRYRSIAAGKLIQIDSKFGFFRSANSVLDLCAAPGGWMQVAVEKMPPDSLIIGVDGNSIRPIDGALSVRESIRLPKCSDVIKKLMAEKGCGAFDVVLHDGSTGIGGSWCSEAINQNALVFDAVKLATELLAPDGTFVTRVFRSIYCSGILFCLSQLFEKVEVYQPQASFEGEFYAVGLKYKAPAKIDLDLLSIRLLLGGKKHREVVDEFRVKKRKRSCDGYEDENTIFKKVCSAADFVSSNYFLLEKRGFITSTAFEDSACLYIKDQTLMTEEVKALCDDLHLYLKQPLEHRLKWRTYTRKVPSPSQKHASTTIPMGNDNEEDEKKVLNETEELTNASEQEKSDKDKKASYTSK